MCGNGKPELAIQPQSLGIMKSLLKITSWIILLSGLSLSVQAGDVVNLSARSTVGSGEDTFIIGFIVKGDPGEQVPILALGSGIVHPDIQNPIADPNITLFKSIPDMPDEVIGSGDNWKEDGQMRQISATGIPPALDESAGMIAWLEPGDYTFHLTDNSGNGGVGRGITVSITIWLTSLRMVLKSLGCLSKLYGDRRVLKRLAAR